MQCDFFFFEKRSLLSYSLSLHTQTRIYTHSLTVVLQVLHVQLVTANIHLNASRLAGGTEPVPRKKSKWDNASKANLAGSLGGAPSISMASTGIAALDFERIRQLTKK